METLERIPFETQKKIFKRLEDIMDVRHLKREDMEKYEESQRIVDNYNLGMYGAWIEGNEKGKAEGKLEGKLETARNMLDSGMPVVQILKFTGLSQEQVESLKS